MLFWISFPWRGGNNSPTAMQTFLAISWKWFGNPLLLIQATPICFLFCRSDRGHRQSSLRHNTREDWMKNLVIWCLRDHRVKWSTPDFLFLICWGPDRKKKSRLNSWTILPANSPSTTAQPSPWKHVSAALIQTRRYNLQLSRHSSTSRGRGGNQTNDKRQKGHFHLDQADWQTPFGGRRAEKSWDLTSKTWKTSTGDREDVEDYTWESDRGSKRKKMSLGWGKLEKEKEE